jgi:hypothetical protein
VHLLKTLGKYCGDNVVADAMRLLDITIQKCVKIGFYATE